MNQEKNVSLNQNGKNIDMKAYNGKNPSRYELIQKYNNPINQYRSPNLPQKVNVKPYPKPEFSKVYSKRKVVHIKLYKLVIFISVLIILAAIVLITLSEKNLENVKKNEVDASTNQAEIKNDNVEKKEENRNENGIAIVEDHTKKEEKKPEEIKEPTIIPGRKVPIANPNAADKIADIYTSKEKVAYLTFDDGPSKNITPQVLDILKEEKIPGTFFVLGSRVEASPEILKRAYDEGHYIANHSFTHVYREVYKTSDATIDEFNQTENAIKNAIGQDYNTYLFRFPGGSWGGYYSGIKKEAEAKLKERGIAHTNWNALTNDAAGAKTTEKQLAEFEKSRKGEHGGLIVLMHDASDKKATPDTLREIIRRLKAEGYTFKNFYEIYK